MLLLFSLWMRFLLFFLVTLPVAAGAELFAVVEDSGEDSSGWGEPSSVCPDTLINNQENVVYEASDYKAKRWAVYFFCLTLILMVAAVIFMKD